MGTGEFKGEVLVRSQNVPSHVEERWRQMTDIFGPNVDGQTAFPDARRGLVYPLFREDRTQTSCFLPEGYQGNQRDREIGEWVVSRFAPSTLQYMGIHLVGGSKNAHDDVSSPVQSVLIKRSRDLLDAPLLSTLGFVMNTMRSKGLRDYGQIISRSYTAEARHFQNLADWLSFFENPSPHLNLGMSNPIGMFKGQELRGNTDVCQWSSKIEPHG
ncbi:MAG: hypothetical protein GY915_05565, partial [bacterium]|nr:hypothetical protein [bacterium]